MGLMLFINTSREPESVAIVLKRRVVAKLTWRGRYDETKKLLRQIEKVLRKAKSSFPALVGIAVAKGPGGFSGLRVGVATANALGFALGIRVYGVRTPEFDETAVLPKRSASVSPEYERPPSITKPRGT